MASLVCAAARIVHVRSRVAELRSSFRGLSLSSSFSVAMPCLLSGRTTQPSLQAPAKLLPIQPVVAAGYKLKTHKVGCCLLLPLLWISCFKFFLLERKDEETLDLLFLGEKWIFLNPPNMRLRTHFVQTHCQACSPVGPEVILEMTESVRRTNLEMEKMSQFRSPHASWRPKCRPLCA